jgi:hypothetical protein
VLAIKVAHALERGMRPDETSPPDWASAVPTFSPRPGWWNASTRSSTRATTRLNVALGRAPGRAPTGNGPVCRGKTVCRREVSYTEFDGRRPKRMIIKVIGE